jgi:NAD(P)H-nitrite reductase large subunit
VVTDSTLRTAVPDVFAAGDVALFLNVLVDRHTQLGTWDSALRQGAVAARNMAGGDEEVLEVPTYATGLFGSTLTVLGVTPAVQPALPSAANTSLEEGFHRKLYFHGERLVGAVLVGPSRGQAELLELMRSRRPVERAREELLELVGPA